MRIEIRSDSVLLDGYVNATARDSKLIPKLDGGRFKEQIVPQAFQRALDRAENIDLLVNHDETRKLGSTKEGNLELYEDGIGLRAICTVTDPIIMDKAKKGKLRGWSFGFYSEKDRWEDTEEEGIQRRFVDELDLFEVSIIDDTRNPAYSGTSIEMRDNSEVLKENRTIDFNAVIVDETIAEKRSEEERMSIYEAEYLLMKAKS